MPFQKEKLLESLRRQRFSPKIIEAFAKIEREKFVPEEFIENAYDDVTIPLPGDGSTISQPSTIATMLQLLEINQNSKILEIGAGSGYVLALMSQIAPEGEIYGVEIKTSLAARSQRMLSDNPKIKIFNADGSLGLSQCAPYDRILISASAPNLETVYQILDQLKDEGILVAPVQESLFQIKKAGNQIQKHEFKGYLFVPLIKKE